MTANSQKSSEQMLVEAAQRGNLESFGELYRRYHSPMVALAYAMLGDRDAAEDAMQEVFVIACRDLPNLKCKEKFGGWLAGICRNVSRQMLRTQGRTISTAREEVFASSDNEDQHRREMVRQAVWSLKQADRELIVMRYFDGFSQAKISEVLGLSAQAVNGRLVRAKRKIAQYLELNGFSGDGHGMPR